MSNRKQGTKDRQGLAARYRLLVAKTANGVFSMDADDRLVSVNPSGLRLFGYEEADMTGKSIYEFIAAGDVSLARQFIKAARQEEAAAGTVHCLRADGTGLPVELSITAFDDGGLQMITSDVRTWRQAEEALKKSEARYRAVVEDQVDLIRRFLPDGSLTFVNSAFCRYFEKPMDELIGTNVMELIAEDDRDRFKEQIFSLTVDRPVAMAERRLVGRDAQVRWQQWVNRAIFDDCGRLLEFQSVGRDITAQKLVEQQLMESEARYRVVVEDQVDLIRRILPDGKLTFVNGAFCRYFGKRLDEIIGENFIHFVPPAHRESILQMFNRLTPENPVAFSEYQFGTAAGNRWVQWNNRALFNEQGEIVEYQSVGRDITAQKEAEIRIAEARAAIERAARVTTLAIIGGGIAHEINQPLNAIRLLAETILLRQQSTGKLKVGEVIKSILNISQQVDRIDNIVNHLRSFLRNSQNYDYIPCNLNDIIEKALSLVSNQLFSRQIEVKKQLASNLPYVYGSTIRLEEVLLNLLMNAMQALDAVDAGSGELVVRTWHDADNVYLEVSDNGPGIDDKIKDRIFEPFFSTKSGDSMGLGLSIVHSIVTASNGLISVGNSPGGGAAIKVSFPVYSGT